MNAVARRIPGILLSVVIWGVLLLCTCLAALAIKDYQDGRFQRVHTDGMAVGATMCGSRS